MALRIAVTTIFDWFCTGLMAATFAVVCTFWFTLLRAERNPHCWKRKK